MTSLTFIAPIADALQYMMLSTGSTLNFGIVTVFAVFAGSLVTALAPAASISKATSRRVTCCARQAVQR